MSETMIDFRQVRVLGPQRDRNKRVWQGQLQLAAPLQAGNQAAIIRNHAIRLLAQRAEPAKKAIQRDLPVVFHEPVLLAAAATTENQVGAGTVVDILEARFAPIALGAADKWRVYSEVRLIPASDWPPADGFKRSEQSGLFELSAPPFSLTQGRIRVGYAPQLDSLLKDVEELRRLSRRIGLNIPTTGPATVFGSLRIAPTKTAGKYGSPARNLPAIAFDLTPDGVEFELQVPNPFAMTATWLTLRLRLEAVSDRTNPELVLRLVGGVEEDLKALSRGLAWMSHDLAEREGAIVLQINDTTVPPLMWPLTENKGTYVAAGPVPAVRLAPDAVVARLLTPQDIDGGEVGVAEFLRPRVELIARRLADPLHLTVESTSGEASGTVPAGARVTLTWTQAAGAGGLELQPDAVQVAGSATNGEFAGTVDTKALTDRLAELWRGTPPTNDGWPPFAFVALERGWLQLPLPKVENQPGIPARSAFNGFIRVDVPQAPAATEPAVRQTLPGLDVLSARSIAADVTWNAPFQHAPRTVTVTLDDATGTLSGTLWVGEASPTPVEILPSLAAGPAALGSVPILFGGVEEAGWNLKVTMDDGHARTIDIARPDSLTTLAWLAHDSQALVSAVAMTRTAENALRPSTTRELVPVEVDADSLRLTFDCGRLPRLVVTSAEPHGVNARFWPWPPLKALRPGATPSSPVEAAGVSLVSLTAAGIEFTAGDGSSAGFPSLRFSLRYDLPLLDELFANAKAPEPSRAQKPDATAPADLPPTSLELPLLTEVWTENARRLARARTDADRVIHAGSDDKPTLWHAIGSEVADTRVDGLFEPYRWKPDRVGFVGKRDTRDLELGAYRLGTPSLGDTEWYAGAGTLDGFNGRFTISGNALTRIPNGDASVDGSVRVDGFAADTRKDGPWRQDTRGLALATESVAGPLRYRDARLYGPAATSALQLATRAEPIAVTIGGAHAQFWFRDLPLKAESNKLSFDPSGGLETAPGPDPAALGSRRLAAALYEWRFCPTDQPRYELKLGGPLSFRPLRLNALTLQPDGTPLGLEIVGSVQIALPDRAPNDGEPFGPERAYETGNLVRLRFAPAGPGLKLAEIGRVDYDAKNLAFKSSDSPLSFVIETDVATGGSPAKVPAELKLYLAGATVDTLPKLSKAELAIRLFGQDCQLSTNKTSIDAAGLRATFQGEPGKVLVLRKLGLEWSAGPGKRPRLTIEGGSLVAPLHAAAAAPHAFERTYGATPDMRWLDLSALQAEETIDHANGVVRLTIDKGLAADAALFRGFLLPAGKLRAAIALVFHAERTASWPAPALVSAIAEFTFDATQTTPAPQRVTAVRHRHVGVAEKKATDKTAPAEINWTSRLLIDASFAPTQDPITGKRTTESRSTIEWPIGGLTLSTTFHPTPDKPATWKTRLAAGPGTLILEHHVQPRICAHELDVANLVQEADETVLDRPWRVRAAVDHLIAPQGDASWPGTRTGAGTNQLEWSSIDELTLIDMGRLLQAARADAKAADRDEPYAFLARYQDLDNEIRIAGVVRRALAGAGFPVRPILRAVREAYRPSDQPKSLLLTGASVTDVAIPKAARAAGEDALGITLVPQWILPWATATGGSRLDGIRPLGRIPQIDAQPQSCEIAVYDAAAGQPRPLDSASATTLGAQDGTQSLIETRLQGLADGKRLIHLIPVDQSFVVRPDPAAVQASLAAGRNEPPLLTRPLMVRTLLGLKTIADRFAAARAQDWREGIVCVVGRTGAAREIRLAVSTWPTNTPTPDEVAPSQSVTLVAMDRAGLKIEVLPEALAATLVDPASLGLIADGGERADAMLRALSLSTAPLLVVLARTDPSYLTIRIREARGDIPNRTGGPTELQALPPHVGWAFVAAPPAALARVEQRALRVRAETLFASAALGWPRTRDASDLSAAQARLGDEEVRRATAVAWAGRVRSLAWPAKAWAADNAAAGTDAEFNTAAFMAMSQRVALRRAAARNLRTPPDRVFVIVPPRARAPVAKALQEALDPMRMPADARRSGLAPLLPGGLEITVTGQRPGVMLTQHEGVLLASENDRFDPGFDRFGRPASRGPLVVRQLRTPRSSALPEEDDLGERRRTFVALNEKTGNALKPFKLMEGPALVVRYGAKDPVAITFRFATPRFGRLASDWAGKIELIASVPDGSATDALARIGLLVEETPSPPPPPAPPPPPPRKLRAQLQVGGTSIDMQILSWVATEQSSIRLTFEARGDFERVRTALRSASADTPVRFTIRCRADGVPPAPGTVVTLGTSGTAEPLVPGPPRTLTFDLPHVPAERRWIPLPGLTLAFGDPAYDRELGSPASTGRAAIDDKPYRLATDRAEYDPSATIHFAFWASEGVPAAGPWALSVAVQPGDGTPERTLKIAGITPLGDARYEVLSEMPYAIPIPALREKDDTPARLRPGDRLAVAVTAPSGNIALTVGLVAEPVLPAPAATYGLAVLRGGSAVATALFASAPLPQVIEFPSLLTDLIAGHVRRRALFLWPFATSRPPPPGSPYAYLVKIDRTGGGQLPNSRADFLPYEA